MRWILFLLLLPFAAFAQVSKCVAADGSVRYSDRPCPSATTSAPVRIRNDMPSVPYLPVLDDPEPNPEPAAPVVMLMAPPPERTGRVSYRCESGVGAIWYQHTPCPRSIRGATGAIYRRADGTTMSEVATSDVTQSVVTRREACKAINAVDSGNRFGSGNDQRASTQDKAKGRDRC